jgi:pimeloyl-ACP methyl ester carboxylesterase
MKPMNRSLAVCLVIAISIGLAATGFWFTGLPLSTVPPPAFGMVGSVNDSVTDSKRSEFFAETGPRLVPFQILYPASEPGLPAPYVPNAEPVTAALNRNQGVLVGLALARIGTLTAPWTAAARPRNDGPFPVVLYLPGVTGYMEMSSFQTAALAADGFVVVTLNQPGNVAAALLPDGRVIEGMSRDEAVRLIAPAYRSSPLPLAVAARLAPEQSIVPYLAADVPAVIDRLSVINADPHHLLHGLLDLERIGIMGVSLGAIVAAQTCHSFDRVKACLMLDAPVSLAVAEGGLRQPALWLSRPPAGQRAERAASGGWPELEIAAQADSIARTVSNSSQARVVYLHGLFHVDFTDVPTIQPIVGWIGMAGPIGASKASCAISSLTINFFRRMTASRNSSGNYDPCLNGRLQEALSSPSNRSVDILNHRQLI